MRFTNTQRAVIEATKNFPIDQTVAKVREELLELHEALGEGFPSTHAIEELADVLIMCERLVEVVGYKAVSYLVTCKLERTLKRVKEGYYGTPKKTS